MPSSDEEEMKKAILYVVNFVFSENYGNKNGDGNLNMQENKA